MTDAVGAALLALALVFFLAGVVGMLRFRRQLPRLHAATKADTVGLLFVVLAVALRNPAPLVLARLALLWLLVLAASATACHLVGRQMLADEAR